MGVLPPYLVASLAISIREDFAFPAGAIGAAAGVSFAVSAITSTMPERLGGRLSLRGRIALAGLLIAASSVSVATWSDSASDIVILMAVHGAGAGIGTPTYSALLAQGVPVQRQGTAFGLLTAAPQIAVLAAGLALPLVAAPIGWRAAFAVPGLASIACLGALWKIGMLSASTKPGTGPEERRRAWRSRSIRRLALASALMSACGVGMRSFLVLFAISIGFSSAAGGLLLSATAVFALVTRIGVGVLGDRRPGDPLARAAGLMVVCAAGFVLMAAGDASLVVLGALLAAGIGWGWQSPLTVAVLAECPGAPAPALGLQLAGFYLGAVVGPPLIALLAEGAGYQVAWSGCCVLSLAGAWVALTARGAPERA